MGMKMNDYETAASREELARILAEESFVLLKNHKNCLPFRKGTIAFFGRAYRKPVLGGMGSGMSFKGKKIPSVSKACEAAGLVPVQCLHEFYKKALDGEENFDPVKELSKAGPDLVASGVIYEIFGRYHGQPKEPKVPKELVRQAAAQTDTAVLVLGRGTGGEECDRHREDDFYLTDSEIKLIENVCAAFPRVALLLNCNGMMDVSWIENHESIQAVLYIGAAGEQGPAAVAEILTGKVSPSGKLAFTMAASYEAYPTAETFSFNKDMPDTIREYRDYGLDAKANGSEGFQKSPVTLYREGIYMGYRYFDSFGRKVLYPFGFGLSYAGFSIEEYNMEKRGSRLEISADVSNLSHVFAGKEVVQVYVSVPSGKLEQPYQRYLGCAKTSLLVPGQKERVTVTVPFREMASYEEETASWILERGCYWIRVGNGSRNTRIIGGLMVKQLIVCEQTKNILPLQRANVEKLHFLSAENGIPITYEGEEAEKELALVLFLTAEDMEQNRPKERTAKPYYPHLEQLSLEQLAAMTVGYGPGLPFGGLGSKAPGTIQDEEGNDITVMTHPSRAYGYVSPALPRHGIVSVRYKDGPAGVGLTAWPTAMLLGCSYDESLLYAFGKACGYEALKQGVDSWLAPGMNLLRNPLGGRNFEYFSEDPYLAGRCGIKVCTGAAANPGVTACPKHFALNEQETYRRGSARENFDAVDSIVQERVARELYLKPFEMVMKQSPVFTIMTSFNKINGIFAAGSHDLCTKLLREEWGFYGAVITDWGDMDIVVNGGDAVAAGNDVIMPGGPPVIGQILKGIKEGRVTREQLLTAVTHLQYFVEHSGSFKTLGGEWVNLLEKTEVEG